MAEIKQTERASKILNKSLQCCLDWRHEFIMPEHLLMTLLDDDNFHAALNIFYSPEALADRLEKKKEIEDAFEDAEKEE